MYAKDKYGIKSPPRPRSNSRCPGQTLLPCHSIFDKDGLHVISNLLTPASNNADPSRSRMTKEVIIELGMTMVTEVFEELSVPLFYVSNSSTMRRLPEFLMPARASRRRLARDGG